MKIGIMIRNTELATTVGVSSEVSTEESTEEEAASEVASTAEEESTEVAKTEEVSLEATIEEAEVSTEVVEVTKTATNKSREVTLPSILVCLEEPPEDQEVDIVVEEVTDMKRETNTTSNTGIMRRNLLMIMARQ